MLVRRWGGEAGMGEEIENGKEVLLPLGRQSGGEEEKGGDGMGGSQGRVRKEQSGC